MVFGNLLDGKMKMKYTRNKAYLEWEERWKRDLKFWFSNQGEELQLCAVAQGYKENLFYIMMNLFASGFTAIKIIKQLEEELK